MSARVRAERCFALARSTTFEAERETAIARGVAIATAARLDLATFDVPGRPKSRPAPINIPFGRHPAPDAYSAVDAMEAMRAFRAHMNGASDALRRFGETLHRREAETGSREGETVYDARRRNFERAAAEAKLRDEERREAKRP